MKNAWYKAAVSRTVAAVAAVIFFAAALSGCSALQTADESGESDLSGFGKVLAASFIVGGGGYLAFSGGGSSDPTSAPPSEEPQEPPTSELPPPAIPNPTMDPPPMPPAADSSNPPLMLSALDDYATPETVLPSQMPSQIRFGDNGDSSDPGRQTLPITGFRYDNADGPQVFVQQLEFAALGIWVNGNPPVINEFDHDYTYAFLGDNIVDDLPSTGMATYDIEGDATYKGVHFFPDGNLDMDFEAGTVGGSIVGSLGPDGSGAMFLRDVRVPDPDAVGGMREATGNDIFAMTIRGIITNNEFGDNPARSSVVIGTGFFADLTTRGGAMVTMDGRFYDASGTTGTPAELAGVMNIVDGVDGDQLRMGFLGLRQP